MADETAESATTEEKPAKATKATKSGTKKKAKPASKKKIAGKKKAGRNKARRTGGKRKAARATKKNRPAKKTKATPRAQKKKAAKKAGAKKKRGRTPNAWTVLKPADLLAYKKENSLSFKALAKFVGKSQVTVMNWAQDNNAPTDAEQKRLKKLFSKSSAGATKPKATRKKAAAKRGGPPAQPEPMHDSGSALVNDLLAAAKRMEDLAAHVGQELGQIDAAIDQLRHSGAQRRGSPPY